MDFLILLNRELKTSSQNWYTRVKAATRLVTFNDSNVTPVKTQYFAAFDVEPCLNLVIKNRN